jgi:hypothetical protein
MAESNIPLNRNIVIASLLLVALGAWHQRPGPPPTGPMVREVPEITPVDGPGFPFKDYTITPIAAIRLRARLLSTERYYWDRSAALSPIDLAVGWRGMSDLTYLKDLRISQGGRWYFFRYKEQPLPDELILTQSKNVHVIPASRDVWRAVKSARRGQVIRAAGSLVKVTGPNGFTWISYPTVGGSGDGSCWVFWVESFSTE